MSFGYCCCRGNRNKSKPVNSLVFSLVLLCCVALFGSFVFIELKQWWGYSAGLLRWYPLERLLDRRRENRKCYMGQHLECIVYELLQAVELHLGWDWCVHYINHFSGRQVDGALRLVFYASSVNYVFFSFCLDSTRTWGPLHPPLPYHHPSVPGLGGGKFWDFRDYQKIFRKNTSWA